MQRRLRPKPDTRAVRGARIAPSRAIAACPNRARICRNIFCYCPAHARAHNEAWDYFKGMDDDDIEKFREEAMIGHRPTWPLGKRGATARTGQGSAAFS